MAVRTFSIDVTKLDKSRLKHVTRKDGTPAIFCDLVIMDRTDDFGNDGFVCQSCTPDERQSGLKMPILGNAKTFGQQAPSDHQQARKPHPQSTEEDDIPF